MFEISLKLPDYVAEFLFYLKFDSIDVFFYGGEMLLFFLLPFEQAFHSLYACHFPIDHSNGLFVP
jgi:hypothetical protein